MYKRERAHKPKMKKVSGNIVDVMNGDIYPGTIVISDSRISDIIKEERECEHYIMPGFVDSHIHIESSMLTPAEFARVAVVHGTVAVVSDPHEIANVLGVAGVRYMIEEGQGVPLKFYFGAPSCVPASPFETNGAVISSAEIEELLQMDEIKYLGEVMNFPGVIKDDEEMHRKLSIARQYAKPIDGHAPGLRGSDLKKYVSCGISTDHECITRAEALEKLSLGMKVMIREGSAAKNFDELIPIVNEHYENCMFCTDDMHPDDLIEGHINILVKRALDYGIDMMKVLRVACVNPVMHYKLDVGLLRKGDYADFIVVDVDDDFNIRSIYINGTLVAEEGVSLIPRKVSRVVNKFEARKREVTDFSVNSKELKYGDINVNTNVNLNINVIEVVDGQLITNRVRVAPKEIAGRIVSDINRDILKLVVINRYRPDSKVAIGFVRNFGLKEGAIASSVAHDSHNIIAVGVSDDDICRAVNLIIENKGGISAVSGSKRLILPLPIGGLMSTWDYSMVATRYREIDSMAKALGSSLSAPLMTLSFMALLVIPKLKLSDKGLFDADESRFINFFSYSY